MRERCGIFVAVNTSEETRNTEIKFLLLSMTIYSLVHPQTHTVTLYFESQLPVDLLLYFLSANRNKMIILSAGDVDSSPPDDKSF